MKKAFCILIVLSCVLISSQASALSVSGNITYIGPGTGNINVAAFDGSGCGNGNVVDDADMLNPGPYTLNLPAPGTYYICACRDTNHNGSCGPEQGEPGSQYQGNPLVLVSETQNPVTGIDITIEALTIGIPTMTEWGMIVFMILAGFGAAVYLRRHRKTGS
jgi:hypothetical protein